MSFTYSNGLPHGARGGFNGFEDMNGYGAMVTYQEEMKPQIYRVCSIQSLCERAAFKGPFHVDAPCLCIGSLFQCVRLRNGS